MSQASKIVVVGLLTMGPATPVASGVGPSLTPTLNLGHERSVAKGKSSSMSPAGSGGTVVPFEGITSASYFALTVLSGTVVVKLTWSGGTDQLVPVSGHWLWNNPTGPFITAITLIGPADVEYVLAGS